MKTILKLSVLLFAFSISTLHAQDDALKITENGNVGINTSNPTEKLEVKGNIKASGNIETTGNVKAKDINASGKLKENGHALLPKGTIVMWYGGNTAPEGWAICNGNPYKNSKGVFVPTPDLRDRFIVGAGGEYSKGNKGGQKEVTLTVNQMPSHSHTVKYDEKAISHENNQGWPRKGVKGIYVTDRDGKSSDKAIQAVGRGEAHENRPPYYALYYIMKL